MSADKRDFNFVYPTKNNECVQIHVIYNQTTQKVLLYEKFVNSKNKIKIINNDNDQMKSDQIKDELLGINGMIADVIQNGIINI
jgi:hypothetical protein